VRYRLMASYQGSPFEAGVGPTSTDIVLFAACPPPEELGFEPATGHWRKQVGRREVQAVWESRPVGLFRGARCLVLDDLGDRLHIGYLGHDAHQAEGLGYWQVDRGVYELVAARNEVSEIVEERTEFPGKAAPHGPPPSLTERPGYQAATPDYSGYPSAESSGYLSSTPAGTSPGYLPSGPIGYRTTSDSGGYSWTDRPTNTGSFRRVDDTGSFARPTDTGSFRQVDDTGSFARPGHQGGPADAAEPPPAQEPPLPLEAEAMRAATQSRRRPSQSSVQRRAAGAGPAASPVPDSPPADDTETAARLAPEPAMVGAAQLPEPVAAPAATRSAPAEDGSAFSAPAAAPSSAAATAAAPTSAAPAPPPTSARAGQGASTAPAGEAAQTAFPAGPALLAGSSPASVPLLVQGMPAGPATPLSEVPATVLPAHDYASPTRADRASPPAASQHRQRHSARRRLATERLFAELANLAAIPVDSYAVGEEVEGAFCLLQTERGFEVFHSVEGNRYELQCFATEESACFYLFGVLAAEAVRTGSLAPRSGTPPIARPPG
jgi:hypothetical protein